MSRDKERQKQIQDKCQNLLNSMLRDDDNKYCVDCDAKGPRWASWNLGIFLCIRCAGIHRNLGVHISKVKSVNLDSWTPEQVVSLQQMGNSRARAVYEANLPDSFRRPQTDSALESFIRAKYEAKKYIAHEWVPAPLPKVDWEKELEEEAEKNRKKKREIKSTVPIGIPKKTEVIPQAIPKPTSSPKTGGRPGRRSVPEPVVSATADLLALDTPSDTASSEDFSGFLSAPGTVEPKARSEEEESFFSQSTPSVPAGNSGKLTTDSILALYSKAPLNVPAQPHIYAGTGGFSGAPFQQPAVQGPSNPFFSLQRPAFQPAGAPFQAAGAPFQYQGFQQPPLVQPVQDSLSENLRNLELGTNQNGLPNQSFFCK